MTVRELKDYINSLGEEADAAQVVIPTSGNGYKAAHAHFDKAEKTKSGELFEHWGDDHMEKGSTSVPILEIR